MKAENGKWKMDFKRSGLLHSPGLAFFCSSSREGADFTLCASSDLYSLFSQTLSERHLNCELETSEEKLCRKNETCRCIKGEQIREEALMAFKLNQPSSPRLFKDTVTCPWLTLFVTHLCVWFPWSWLIITEQACGRYSTYPEGVFN